LKESGESATMVDNCKNNSGCQYFESLIQKRLDGDITPGENRELDKHLSECPHCLDELVSFAGINDMLNQAVNDPVEAPDDFFEALNEKLDEVEPARGLSGLLQHPFFNSYRTAALATTSFILVAVLVFSVGMGAANRSDKGNPDQTKAVDTRAMILSNNGDAIMLNGDEDSPDKYSAALDDLEKAYREALGQDENGSGNQGYIHTSWNGGESATPIH
jgi:hypothetical protein